MTVATLAEVLQPAIANRTAVAGLVVLGWEDARAYVEAAEEAGLPVILQAGPGCRAYTPLPVLGKMFRVLAEQSRFPVVCHIDHAYSAEECAMGLDHGFSSVMIDGSRLPIDDNIAITARVAEMAHRAGASVEGEVGVVGYIDGAASAMTSPEDARRFDEESGVDALAISAGNIHLSTGKTAGIDFGIVRRIEAVTRSPLVLHGGSGIPPAIRRQLARETRVKKFNIGTELRMAFGAALRKSLADQPDCFDRLQLLGGTIAPLRREARAVMTALANDM